MAKGLDELALGKASAAVCAAGMLLLSLFGKIGIYMGAVNAMMQWHMFFNLTLSGIVLGMVEAAVWGFVGGYAVAWAYNKML